MAQEAGFFKLNYKDFLKGLIMTVIGAIIGAIMPIIQSGEWVFDWTSTWHIAAAAGVGYIVKNLFTNSEDKFLKPEPKPTPPPTE